ncbi:hypothetical protein [Nocardia sp. NBC_01388]|uniref:hypothetical protein n=1 Tax=Nocardia sp. NBC_01388 TaxID=2903596 RepID=UPI00324CABCC
MCRNADQVDGGDDHPSGDDGADPAFSALLKDSAENLYEHAAWAQAQVGTGINLGSACVVS